MYLQGIQAPVMHMEERCEDCLYQQARESLQVISNSRPEPCNVHVLLSVSYSLQYLIFSFVNQPRTLLHTRPSLCIL
jgi:hypothetical protein